MENYYILCSRVFWKKERERESLLYPRGTRADGHGNNSRRKQGKERIKIPKKEEKNSLGGFVFYFFHQLVYTRSFVCAVWFRLPRIVWTRRSSGRAEENNEAHLKTKERRENVCGSIFHPRRDGTGNTGQHHIIMSWVLYSIDLDSNRGVETDGNLRLYNALVGSFAVCLPSFPQPVRHQLRCPSGA